MGCFVFEKSFLGGGGWKSKGTKYLEVGLNGSLILEVSIWADKKRAPFYQRAKGSQKHFDLIIHHSF
jgi:hypothetical protein